MNIVQALLLTSQPESVAVVARRIWPKMLGMIVSQEILKEVRGVAL